MPTSRGRSPRGSPRRPLAGRGSPRWNRKSTPHSQTSNVRNGSSQLRQEATVFVANMAANTSIRDYIRSEALSNDSSSWLSKDEIPSPFEINGAGENEAEQTEIEVPVNRTKGTWVSTTEYLSAHYQLLREDTVAPLRNVVSEMRAEPENMEKDSQEKASIYEKVFIIGLTFSVMGIGAKITFSLRRAGKKVPWEQSQRLITGSMVALTPAKDMFKKICRIAIVAARPLAGVQQNPCEIDLFFATPDQIEIDPQEEWVMVECRDAYFEGSRHTLRSLQKIANEAFPLSEYLVRLERNIEPPRYLREQPRKNLSTLYPSNPDVERFFNVDLINDWPQEPTPVLDASQYTALRRILTNELAIIQGPPGTGKTHVSVVALDLLLRNKLPEDPPIIVAAHTNHAVDQMLRHVANFEPDFIRLGGRSTDVEIIKPRTLYEIKKAEKAANPAAPKPASLNRQRQLAQEMVKLLAPLTVTDQPFPSEVFKQYGLLTEAQYQSLQKGAAEWVRVDQGNQVPGHMAMWLGRDLVAANTRTMPEDFGIDIEEVDLEFEQIKEMEAESKIDDDEVTDILRGPTLALKEPYTGRKTQGVTEDMIKSSLQKQDLWEIKEACRGPVYRFLQQQVKDKMIKAFRQLAAQYAQTVEEAKISRWQVDAMYLRNARIIGMTTTGLSKYRGLIQSLKPKIVMIEEAAETLEAYVTAACFDSLDHLILVGDHKQLRGHCNVHDLEGDPWYLDVSMFERLVQNEIGYSTMIKQRRMIPEIRRALKPIYDELQDHESVLDRPPIRGMGGVNTFFFSHEWPEATDILKSKINEEEADMIVGFFDYLVYNGMEAKGITVLTFYNGQRKLILRKLRNHPNLQGSFFKVVTVDSYQGEENDVVLLSLVRNNTAEQIGFLSIGNRVCVALSRARRGFYLFGNTTILSHASNLWWDVITEMSSDPKRVGLDLPLVCETHGTTTYISNPSQFLKISGGCEMPCRDELPCGHVCALTCHPFSHEMVNCKKPCSRTLECGHKCIEICYLPCVCACTKEKGRSATEDASAAAMVTPPRSLRRSSDGQLRELTEEGQAFRDFAAGGHVQSDAEMASRLAEEAMAQLRLEQADQEMAKALFGTDEEREAQKVRLVKTETHANGAVRGVWKGTYLGEVGDEGEEKRSGRAPTESSLLD